MLLNIIAAVCLSRKRLCENWMYLHCFSMKKRTIFGQIGQQVVKECLRTLFVNDASSARPEGSMEVVKLYWWEHNCKDGQYSSAKVHRSVHVTAKDIAALPNSVEDYTITLDELPGLMPEIIEGV